MYEVGGCPDNQSFSADTSIQSIIIKILGDSTSLDHDTTPPNTRYKVKNLGTWNNYNDVDNFLKKCNHYTGYYGASIGSTITIKDGTYNKIENYENVGTSSDNTHGNVHFEKGETKTITLYYLITDEEFENETLAIDFHIYGSPDRGTLAIIHEPEAN